MFRNQFITPAVAFILRLVVLLLPLGVTGAANAQTIVCVDSSLGEFCMELLEQDAPETTANFLNYVTDGDYDETLIHRSVRGSQAYIEAGLYAASLNTVRVPADPPIANEFKVSNTRGTVAMLMNDENPDSATSGWFVNITDNSASFDLDGNGATVFARVIGNGMDIVDQISALPVLALNNTTLTQTPVLSLDDSISPSDLVNVNQVYIYDGDSSDFSDSDTDTTDGTDTDDTTDNSDSGTSTDGPSEVVCMNTTLGEICIRLFRDVAPQNVENFLTYVNGGDYDGTFFHRSVQDFIIQGGGYFFSDELSAQPVPKDAPVINEFRLSNVRGTVAMAKLDGDPNSATSEWFINLADNSLNLDNQNGGFTVFGEVLAEDMAIVDEIAAIPTLDLRSTLGSPFGDTPLVIFDNNLSADDFVTITGTTVSTQDLPDTQVPDASDPGTGNNDNTLTTYQNNRFTVPVKVGNRILRVTLFLQSASPDYVFNVDTTSIVEQKNTGQITGVFANNKLTIPSASVGASVFTNLVFNLTDFATLEFTLQSFERP